MIKLAQRFDIKGIGVDKMPELIEEANRYAAQYAVTDRDEFKNRRPD